MPILGPEPIDLEGIKGDRYWFEESYPYTGVADVDERLNGFPVEVYLPQNRPAKDAPLVIGLQGVSAPIYYNEFIVPPLTQMGFAVALLETLFAGERSLVRTDTKMPQKEILPLVKRKIPFNTELLLRLFQQTSINIAQVHQLCCDRYGISQQRLSLFGVSMGVLFSSYAFTADGIGERLFGAIGHSDLLTFVKSWSGNFLPNLASPFTPGAEEIMRRTHPDIKSVIKLLKLAKVITSDTDEYARACNPMNYIDRVKLPRRARFLVGEIDNIIDFKDAEDCARRFPDGEAYVVPDMGHGSNRSGPNFLEHTLFFLTNQLADWAS
jgi:hypothetical protein